MQGPAAFYIRGLSIGVKLRFLVFFPHLIHAASEPTVIINLSQGFPSFFLSFIFLRQILNPITLHFLRSEAVTVALQLRSKTLASPFNSRLGCGDSFSTARVLAQLSQVINQVQSLFWSLILVGILVFQVWLQTFNFVFLYGLVFFFCLKWWLTMMGFCLGTLLMMGLGLRRVAF